MKYVARGYCEDPLYDDDKNSLRPDISVDGLKNVDTGLVTRTGEKIWRLGNGIGFTAKVY